MAETEMRSILRIELSPAQGGTALVLDHRNVGLESAIGMGAGWHAHLEALGDLLEGRDADADRWRPRFESLLPRYAELVSSR
jgi:hypothetical protein